MVGHNVSHAKNRTRKIFRPNLHPAKITVDGTTLRVRLCTKCLRQIKSPNSAKASLGKQNSTLEKSEVSSAAPVAAGLV